MTKEERKEYNRLYNIKNKAKIKQQRKQYLLKNKEREVEYRRQYRLKNREKILKSNSDYRLKNKDEILKKQSVYRIKNKDKIINNNANRTYGDKEKETTKNYRINNRDKIRNYQKEYIKKRYNSDLSFKIKSNIRTRLIITLKNNYKSAKTIELLGCSISEFKKYFESKFTEGMSWEKYRNGEIHIDHIIPCDVFDLSKEEAQKICFHYTNLQPLWGSDNVKKSNKLNLYDLIKIENTLILKENYRKLLA